MVFVYLCICMRVLITPPANNLQTTGSHVANLSDNYDDDDHYGGDSDFFDDENYPKTRSMIYTV